VAYVGSLWGIVVGLVALVATIFVCIGLLYSNAKGLPKEPGGRLEESSEAVSQASTGHRKAA
jgi:hypothetical protein